MVMKTRECDAISRICSFFVSNAAFMRLLARACFFVVSRTPRHMRAVGRIGQKVR